MQQNRFGRVCNKVTGRPNAETILNIHPVDKVLRSEPSDLVEDPHRHEGSRSHGAHRAAIPRAPHHSFAARLRILIPGVNRNHTLSLSMRIPCLEHTCDEAVIDRAVLVEQYDPWITVVLRPANALIQTFCNAQILRVFDQLKTESLSCLTQLLDFVSAGAIVYHGRSLNLRRNSSHVVQHFATWMVGDNHRADRLRCNFVPSLGSGS